jgi:hypothetical protein
VCEKLFVTFEEGPREPQVPTSAVLLLQLGHQAAQCTNGTINWRRLYGDESFRLKQPLYESQLLQIHKEREIDLEALETRARQYAEVSPLASKSGW